MRLIPRTVMVGFVNALAILIFLAPLVAIVALTGAAAYGELKVINIKSGDRTRLSTFLAGFFLLVLILAFGDLVAVIPMAALVAVMFVVAIATFDGTSLHVRSLRRTPRSETAVMVVTVAIVAVTHNLAYGVVAGVLLRPSSSPGGWPTWWTSPAWSTRTAASGSTPSPVSCSSPPRTSSCARSSTPTPRPRWSST